MLIPEAHEIYVCGAGCLRGEVLTAAEMGTMDRFSTVAIRENNLLDGDMEDLIIEGVSDILGKRADEEVSKKVKELLTEEPEVLGAYDLFLHNYGPDKYYGSVHLELPDTMTVKDVDILTRRVQAKIYRETGIIMTGVGVYSHNTTDDEASEIRNRVQKIVMDHEWALQMHGFYLDQDAKDMRFDVVMSFDVDHREGLGELYKEVGEAFPDYHLTIAPDIDITD
jgi:hypothetical protein